MLLAAARPPLPAIHAQAPAPKISPSAPAIAIGSDALETSGDQEANHEARDGPAGNGETERRRFVRSPLRFAHSRYLSTTIQPARRPDHPVDTGLSLGKQRRAPEQPTTLGLNMRNDLPASGRRDQMSDRGWPSSTVRYLVLLFRSRLRST